MIRQLWCVAAIACAFGMWAVPSFAQDPPKPDTPKQEEKKPETMDAIDVSGTWDLTVEMHQGPMTVNLTIKVENEKLTGTIKGPQIAMDVEGTVSAKELAFAGKLATGNGDVRIGFTGAPGKEKMEGTLDFGGRPGGKWSATRAKPQ